MVSEIVEIHNRKLYIKFDAIISNGYWTGDIRRKSTMAASRHAEMRKRLLKKAGIKIGQLVMLFHKEIRVNYMWITK